MAKQSFFSKLTGIKKSGDDADDTSPEITDGDRDTHDQKDQGDWMQKNDEGQLSVDVYQTDDEIVLKSAVAGVDPKDLDISMSNDMITIRGTRNTDEQIPSENYYYQECYWGAFSRSIILPQEVHSQDATADFKKGILTIRLPKAESARQIKISVHENS